MAFNSGNNPEVVKTSLDEVLYPAFSGDQHSGLVRATDPLFFKQGSIDRGSVIFAEYQPPAEFGIHIEEQVRELETVRTANKTTVDVVNYKKTLPVPKEFFDDEQHSEVVESVRLAGRKGRMTQDHEAIRRTYADGFDGNVSTTPDGSAIYVNAHTALDGSSIDNLETGTLTPDNLKTVFKSLVLQKDQRGELGGHTPAGLLVPHTLFPLATEITESELVANSAENNLNYFSRIYPGLRVGYSGYLDSTYNSATNADTSYYVVSPDHSVSRVEREGMSTNLVGWEFDSQDRYMYKLGFREVVTPKTWEGTVASNGTV